MKNILSLSLCLTLVACASGLPELKYADGSGRIPVNPKPIPLSVVSQPAAVSQPDKPGDASASVPADPAKPAAKFGCHRPPEKSKAIGFDGLDKVQYVNQKSQPIFYH